MGRSMPLTLDKCGSLGGDVEMTAVVQTLAKRHPEHTFVLIGHNDGSSPTSVGLPSNVENPWTEWRGQFLREKIARGVRHSNLTMDEHFIMRDIYDELTLDTILGLDGIILWAGQHGTTNSPIPGIRDSSKLTKPHDWSAHYCSYLLRGVNLWRDVAPREREEIWLNADPRNHLKMRDLKWPLQHPILTQRAFEHNIKHERYNDGRDFDWWYSPHGPLGVDVAEDGVHTNEVWRSRVHNVYSRLEINGLVPDSPFGNLISFNDAWDRRGRFGLFINEARRYVTPSKSRLVALRDWVLPLSPDWIHGTWSNESQKILGRKIDSAPWDAYYRLLHSVRCTFTTPSSGSGWATTKPWEAFAAGTVCFFHPLYDDQDNILNDAPQPLRDWLRVTTLSELQTRVQHLNSPAGRHDWGALVRMQREHFDQAMSDLTYVKMIDQRLFGDNT